MVLNVVAIVLQVLLGLGFLMAGGGKLANTKQSITQRDHLRVAPWFWTTTGALEVLGALGVLVGIFYAPLAAAAAIGLALVMLGATYTHILRRQPVAMNLPTTILFIFAIIVVIARWSALTNVFHA